MIKISVYFEDNLVTEFEQAQERDITIGRAPGCAIHLDEPSVSRLHVLIKAQGGRWTLERKANFGAVLLNGQEIENAPLEGGEEITIGKFSLRVNIEGSRSAVSTPSFNAGDDDGDGRTRIVSTSSAAALFRMEPGAANVAEFQLEKELAVFGRGSNCDVVLTEKKASRKHFEVRRQGLSFFLKDLGSANGTMVNGRQIEGEVELVPGDVIKVGESQLQFTIENKDFFRAQDQFLPVPAHLEKSALDAGGYDPAGGPIDYGGPGAVGYGEPGMGEAPPPAEPPLSSTDFLGRAKRAWFGIPKAQRMRYLTILVVGSLVMALLGAPDEEKKPPTTKARTGSTSARSFENLTKKQQTMIIEMYGQLLKAQEAKDYQGMKDTAGKILVYVDDYKDTKNYETIAAKQLEQIEENRRQALLQAEMEKRRQEVKALEEKGKVVFEKALADARFRTELDALIQEIYSKDPNNSLVNTWKARLKEKEEEDRRLAEEAEKREELQSAAGAALAAVRATFEAGRYVAALAEAEKLHELPWKEQEFQDQIEALKGEIRGRLSSIIDPLLREASSQRGEGGDLIVARDRYSEVLKTDPNNREATEGLEAIYEVLQGRAKRYYTEALLAEHASDLVEARDRFEKCLRSAPEKSIYRKRCRAKLARFESFGNIPGVGGGGP